MSTNTANPSVHRQLANWAELVDQTIVDLRRTQAGGSNVSDSRRRLGELLIATRNTAGRNVEAIVLNAIVERDAAGIDLKALGDDLVKSTNAATLIARLEPLATALERKREQAAAKMMIR